MALFGGPDVHPAEIRHPQWRYAYRPNSRQVVRGYHGEFPAVTAHFNADGLAMRAPLPEPGTPSLVFLGNSFTAGLQVPEESRFVSLCASALKLPAANFGCGRFSPLLESIQLAEFSDRLTPKAVVLEISAADVERDYANELMAQRTAEGRVVSVADRSPVGSLLSRSHIGSLVERGYEQWRFQSAMRARSEEDWVLDPLNPLFTKPLDEWFSIPERRVIENSIKSLHEFCLDRGWRLFLMPIPDRGAVFKGQTDYFAEYFTRFARQYQIELIDLSGPFRGDVEITRLFFHWDGHLSPEGHALVAQEMVRVLRPAIEAPGQREAAVTGASVPMR